MKPSLDVSEVAPSIRSIASQHLLLLKYLEAIFLRESRAFAMSVFGKNAGFRAQIEWF